MVIGTILGAILVLSLPNSYWVHRIEGEVVALTEDRSGTCFRPRSTTPWITRLADNEDGDICAGVATVDNVSFIPDVGGFVRAGVTWLPTAHDGQAKAFIYLSQ